MCLDRGTPLIAEGKESSFLLIDSVEKGIDREIGENDTEKEI